jgi:hypothetical protein
MSRPDTYAASYRACNALMMHWRYPSTIGGSTSVEVCPACAGALTVSKNVYSGRISGTCATPFCVQFSE